VAIYKRHLQTKQIIGAGEGIRTLDPDLGKFRYLVAFR
jgi:hypothetical protein